MDELDAERQENLELDRRSGQANHNQRGFYCNRESLLEAYCQKRIYGITVTESAEMFAKRAERDEIFVRCDGQPNPDYLLPCFCEVDEEDSSVVVRIWTSPRARRRGLATAMLKALNITSAAEPLLPDSMDFWRKVLPRLGGVAPVAPFGKQTYSTRRPEVGCQLQ